MKITLAQAVHLRSIIGRRIQELVHERVSVSTVQASKGEKYEKPERTMEEVTLELNEARKHYRELDFAATSANLQSKISWDGEEISITEALEISKQLRGEVSELKRFGQRKKQEKEFNYRSESESFVYAMYEPEVYRQNALKLERKVNRLSQEIEATNHRTDFEFAPASIYLEY